MLALKGWEVRQEENSPDLQLARFLCINKYSPCGQFQAAINMSLTKELGRDAHNWLLGAGGSWVQHTPRAWDQIGACEVTASRHLFHSGSY